jgi:hypothetical protein
MKTRIELDIEIDNLRDSIRESIIEMAKEVPHPIHLDHEEFTINFENNVSGLSEQGKINWIDGVQYYDGIDHPYVFVMPDDNSHESNHIENIMDIHDLMMIYSIFEDELENQRVNG